MDEYLPPTTLHWVKEQLAIHGISHPEVRGGQLLDNGSRMHVHAYTQLRDITRRHLNSNALPILSESAKPEGGYEWLERRGGYLADLIKENARIVAAEPEGDEREEAEIEGEEMEVEGA